jgi:Tfp pilus assembly protein PilX
MNGWYRSAVQVSLSASDTLSGVQNSYYRIDGGAIQTYASPFSISASGQHAVDYWSTDIAGNSEATRSLSIKIDTIAPVVSATASPSTAPKNPRPVTVTISGSVTDGTSGAGNANYSVVDEYGVTQPSGPVTLQANGNYSFTLSLPATKTGQDKDGHLYTITVRGFDQAGNSASATATVRIN